LKEKPINSHKHCAKAPLLSNVRFKKKLKKKPEKIVQAETESGQLAGDAIVEVVENQLNENDPPETKQTLERLIGLGESRENAIRFIASALCVEIYEALKNKTPYNKKRYLKNLKALPELPDA